MNLTEVTNILEHAKQNKGSQLMYPGEVVKALQWAVNELIMKPRPTEIQRCPLTGNKEIFVPVDSRFEYAMVDYSSSTITLHFSDSTIELGKGDARAVAKAFLEPFGNEVARNLK